MSEKRYIIDVEDENYENAVFCGEEFICYEDDSEQLVNELNKLRSDKELLNMDYKNCLHRNRTLINENEQLKREVKRLKCINKQLEERLDKDIALNMDCGDVCMMEKTKLIFKNDVMEGYVHYINFKRDFSGALETFKKYILPIECNISIDANKDWLILTFSYGEEDEDYLEILKEEWDTVTTFLKEENIQFAYPSQHDDWGIVILIDDFVEYVVKKYVLEGNVK